MPNLLSSGQPLADALHALDLSLDALKIQQLLDYLALIQKWNRVYNLTAVRDPADMWSQHILDSLAVMVPLRRHLQSLSRVVPESTEKRLLDVGSGAGLPGVVMAICYPELSVTCVDTVGKKAAFIQQVAATLKLPNLRGMHARVETIDSGFDVVTSRAFASLVDFTTWSRQALGPGGVWMAMKGKEPLAEIAALPSDVQVFHVEHLAVPGLDAERCIVWMRPVDAPAADGRTR